jgi:pimeloyl-ACP methyl ester carboxylesterase
MKKTLFIIHGWAYSLDKWTDICIALRARGIEPVLLKVPGLTEPSTEVWDIQGYQAWLDGKLKGHDKPVVLGHSNGGRIALSYAQKYPGRLGQLILVDSAGVAHEETKKRLKLQILKVIAKAGKIFGKIPVIKKIFYKLIGAQDYMNAPPNMRITMQNMLAADKTIDLSAIQLPLTIIWGQDDAITPLGDGQKINRSIKGSDLHIIIGGRHSPQATHPEQVADIIAKALKK